MSFDFKVSSNAAVSATTATAAAPASATATASAAAGSAATVTATAEVAAKAIASASTASTAAAPDKKSAAAQLQRLKSVTMPAMEAFIKAKKAGQKFVESFKSFTDMTIPDNDDHQYSDTTYSQLVDTLLKAKECSTKMAQSLVKAGELAQNAITLCNGVFAKTPPTPAEQSVIVGIIEACAAQAEVNHRPFETERVRLLDLAKLFSALLKDKLY
jgi:uncharacterized protein (DUF885 family)